ncbi:Uncharacterised protein [Salmonella enterica subsp. houtenae]|nr:Uncharacterised protein [Salmonella enterica subsp. houtenae]
MSSKAKAFCLSAVLVVVCFGIYLTVPNSHEGSVQGFAAQSVIRGDIKETVMLTGIVKPFRKVKVGGASHRTVKATLCAGRAAC